MQSCRGEYMRRMYFENLTRNNPFVSKLIIMIILSQLCLTFSGIPPDKRKIAENCHVFGYFSDQVYFLFKIFCEESLYRVKRNLIFLVVKVCMACARYNHEKFVVIFSGCYRQFLVGVTAKIK